MWRHRYKRTRRNVIFVLLCLVLWFIKNHHPEPSDPLRHPHAAAPTYHIDTSFLAALHQVATPDKVVILTYVDYMAIEIAENFYESSLRRHGIDNVMFVTSDKHCGDKMAARQLPCHVHHRVDGGDNSKTRNDDNSEIFLMIATALDAGYTVLHADIDGVFLKNPFDHIKCTYCDMAVMPDLDPGFFYVYPTRSSRQLFNYITELALMYKQLRQRLPQIVREVSNTKHDFKLMWLPQHSFQDGHLYFELGLRTYYGQYPCANCVVVQNNGLRSVPAKIYRLKENMMWVKDTDAYYSSKTRKYLFYNNPLDGAIYNTEKLEKSALASALAIGKVLNRTVILPRFYCTYKHGHCGLNSLYNVTTFDAVFGGLYREHVFLGNEKVPEVIRESQTHDYIIATAIAEMALRQIPLLLPFIQLVPSNRRQGATSDEIRHWFDDIDDSVLCFHSLYSAFDRFTDATVNTEFKQKLKWGLQLADYYQ